MKNTSIKLSLSERIVLSSMLKRYQGSYLELLAIRDLCVKLEPTQKEVSDYQIRPTPKGDALTWSKEAQEKEFCYEVSSFENEVIVKILRRADSDGMINLENISVYELFLKGH